MGIKRTAVTEKIDLFKKHSAEYVAPATPQLVTVGAAHYLAVTGRGRPGGDEFQAKLGALFGVAFTIKMTRKFAGKGDYVVGKLEGQYWPDPGVPDPLDPPLDDMNWRLMIRTPEMVGRRDLTDAVEKLTEKGKGDRADEVELYALTQGVCVQMLHVGPYDQEMQTVRPMLAFAESKGYRYDGPHHEIYLSDPRRVPPDRLRTILRLPLSQK
jgi:hypothetical protein